jgi:sec-independent protein translocase protein TatC
MEEEKHMSFLEHLEELRWRLVRAAIAVLVISSVLFIYQEWIMDNLFLSMKKPDFISFRLMCEWFGVCIDEIPVKMQSMTVGGQFSYGLMMSIMGGIVLSFPFLFYQIWSFVRPGLRQNEQKVVKGLTFYVSGLFFLGIGFGYFLIAPLAIQFFGTYQISSQIENNFTVNSYMSTILSTVFYSGLLFLLPIVAYIFTRLGVITPAFLRKYRKHAIVGVLILAAVITPPDLISQVIVAIPITLLYEVGIFVSARVEKNMIKEQMQR